MVLLCAEKKNVYQRGVPVVSRVTIVAWLLVGSACGQGVPVSASFESVVSQLLGPGLTYVVANAH